MTELIPYVWLAGLIHVCMIGAQIPLSRLLHFKENLSKVTPIIRQIFIVHYIYIALYLLTFSVLCLLFAPLLVSGTDIGKSLSGFMALFWILRIFIQLFYYDPEIKKKNRLGHVFFTSCFVFLSLVFTLSALGS